MNTPFYRSTHFFRDISISLTWLLFLFVVNQNSRVPVISIIPYMIPVAVVAWRHGIGWGFVLAALGTLSALPEGYLSNHVMDDLYWAAFTTYLKLTAAAVGIILGKKIASRRKTDE